MFRSILIIFTLISLSSAAEYTLQKDDSIRMTVHREKDLDTTAQIGKLGRVSFPLIGSVKLEGLTVKEAEDQIKEAYEKDYLVNASVSLTVVGYAPKWVIVGGDVRSPGTITIPEDGALDLSGAITQAGGVLETANENRILVRHKDGTTETHSLANSPTLILKHGDSIKVTRASRERTTLTVTGLVNRPGVVEFPKEGRLDILTTIAQAGGFNRLANRKIVTVRRGERPIPVNIRDISEGKLEMFYMMPGDILIVAESRF